MSSHLAQAWSEEPRTSVRRPRVSRPLRIPSAWMSDLLRQQAVLPPSHWFLSWWMAAPGPWATTPTAKVRAAAMVEKCILMVFWFRKKNESVQAKELWKREKMLLGIGRLSCCDDGQLDGDRGPFYNDSEQQPVDRTFLEYLATSLML